MTIQNPVPPSGGNGKAYAAAMAGAIVTVVAYFIDTYGHHALPGDVVSAMQTVVTVGLVYFTPHSFGG